MSPQLPALIVQIALSMVGRHEQPLGSNKGPQIQEFFDADYYKPNAADNGYAWCASFVCRVVQLAMLKAIAAFTFSRPRTPSAFGLIDWSLAQDLSTNTKRNPGNDIKAGDIVIYGFSHTGVCVKDCNSIGHFDAVEGNTNQAGSREGTHVLRKLRHRGSVIARIRFTV